MGWLRFEVDQIDSIRGDWAHLREQPGDPPAGPATVTTRGQRVPGLRIDGDSVTQEEFVPDGGFRLARHRPPEALDETQAHGMRPSLAEQQKQADTSFHGVIGILRPVLMLLSALGRHYSGLDTALSSLHPHTG